MPYAHIRKRIPRALDRRVKISDEQKNEVRSLYKQGFSQRGIARKTGVSRRMVQFILFPEKEARCKEQLKERRIDGRYYDKDKWREQMRRHRRYKQSIKDRLIKK